MLLDEDVSDKKHRDLLNTVMRKILGDSPPAESFQYVGEVRTTCRIWKDLFRFYLVRKCVTFLSLFIFLQVVHIFSHIHQTYVVYSAELCVNTDGEEGQKICWLSSAALQEAAVSTGVKKVCAF